MDSSSRLRHSPLYPQILLHIPTFHRSSKRFPSPITVKTEKPPKQRSPSSGSRRTCRDMACLFTKGNDFKGEEGFVKEAFYRMKEYHCINALCRVGNFKKARFLLDQMQVFAPDVVTYNCLIDGCCKTNRIGRALELFEDMKKRECVPNQVTYNSFVKYYSVTNEIERGVEMMGHGVPGSSTNTPLIHALVETRRVAEARGDGGGREAATTLSQIEQPLVTETVSKKQALKLLEAELKPLKKSIIKHDLLKNLVTCIFVELTALVVLALTSREGQRSWRQFLDSKCCMLILDVDCHDLTRFSLLEHYQQNLVHQKNAKVQQREANTQQAQQSLFNNILTIMTDILKEEASSSLVGVILQNLVKEGKIPRVRKPYVAHFINASKAEDFFHKFDQMDDTSIFDALTLLLDELTFTKAQTITEKFLERIGANHQLFDFLRILSTKCAPTIFSSEHVRYLLEQLSSSTSADTQLKASFIKLLLVILNMFPSYLRGLGKKKQFSELLEDNDSFADEVTEALSKAAPYISANFSDYSTVLEKMCLEGTRSQAKHAVSAIASLARHLKNLSFPSYARVSTLAYVTYPKVALVELAWVYGHLYLCSESWISLVEFMVHLIVFLVICLCILQKIRMCFFVFHPSVIHAEICKMINATREAGGVDQREVDHSLIVQINMIVFLIHVLAHDPDFPSEDCMDEHVYARFCG
ncbi:hypothetical protein Bca101_006630 [Brassica carinata]